MRLSPETIDVLKNFSTINFSLNVKAGNKLSTIAIARNIVAESTIKDTFPSDFAIYSLSEFIGVLSLFNTPDISFDEKFLIVREEGDTRGGIKYGYCNPALIVFPTKEIKLPEEVDLTFTITKDQIAKLQKAGGILNVPDIKIKSGKDGVFLIVQDNKNSSSNSFQLPVSDVKSKDLELSLKLENIKVMPMDYVVRVSARGFSIWTSADGSIQYAITLEAN